MASNKFEEVIEMRVLGVAKVYNNKVWIPKIVRDKLNISDGDLVYFYENDNDEIVIKKAKRVYFEVITTAQTFLPLPASSWAGPRSQSLV
jgi:looped-hinge helix DNA binding domain, AbrB family